MSLVRLRMLALVMFSLHNTKSDSEESDDYPITDKQSRRKRLSKKRIMEIPNFEYDEISGDFEADENGSLIAQINIK